MPKAPAFQFYAADFLTGTILMSNAEVGLFIRLLCLQAEHGSIPDDVERIVRAYGEEARTLWAGVKPKFNRGSTEGTLVNERLCEVLAARDEFRKRQSEKGKASAAIRALGSTKPKKRFNRGSTVVEPLGDRDRDIVLTQKGKERARVIVLPWPTPSFEAAWQLWKKYKSEKGARYKPIGEQSALVKLSKDYPNEQAAIAAMEYSMAQNYQGIFPPKKDLFSNGSPKHQTDEQYRDEVARIFAERQANRDRLAAERASAETGG